MDDAVAAYEEFSVLSESYPISFTFMGKLLKA